MSYASDMALGGALSGIDEGIEYGQRRQLTTAKERREREAHDLRMRTTASAENRAASAEQRATESHGLGMEASKLSLDDAKFKAKHAEFLRGFDDGMRRFVLSGGSDYQGLVDSYNNGFPDGMQLEMTRRPDGKFDLDFGEGITKEAQSAEEVAGLASYITSVRMLVEQIQLVVKSGLYVIGNDVAK